MHTGKLVFAQLMMHVPLTTFRRCVAKYNGEHKVKQFFQNESEALRYIQFLSAYYGPITYTNSGLVIGYKVIDIPNEKPTRSLTAC